MAQFVLTAQLQLQAPRNASKVVNQIQNQLKGVQIPVTVKSAAQATKQINQVTAATNKAASAAEAMGRSFGSAIKRFAAFTVASRAVSLFTNSLANAVDEAIDFQREVVKIAQVTGKTVKDLKGLEQTITRLSVTLGTSSKELLSTARILSQAGIKAGDLKVAIEALAKTTLAPTFEDINKTAEGAVAILAQFEGGVGRLEKQLGAINAVAGQFAVESGDLISAVRRFGGVFKSAGGELEELLALFTSVRATTRESSESIATGLRTIFTRIQRPKTIEFLRQFGVELLDVNGKFIGPLKAVEQLNKAFAGLEQGDITFVRVAEELGGFRQIGKVIPLIQQYGLAVDALNVAQEGQNSLSADAEKAQQALAVQITKVKEEFLALVRGIAGSDSFQLFARTALEVASALIKVADAIRPLIPLIGALAAFKFARGLGSFASSAGSALRGLGKNQGGVIQQFARGGFVPGQGNRDTVPAMLTPGEFVIKKSSAQKLGAGTLQAMNENRFNNGTTGRGVKAPLRTTRDISNFTVKDPLKLALRKDRIGGFILNPAGRQDSSFVPSGANNPYKFTFTNEKTIRRLAANQNLDPKATKQLLARGVPAQIDANAGFPEFYPAAGDLKKNSQYNEAADRGAKKGLKEAIKRTVGIVDRKKLLDLKPEFKVDTSLLSKVQKSLVDDQSVVSTVSGYLFEGMVGALTGAIAAGGKTNFDFPSSSLSRKINKLEALFGPDPRIRKIKKAEGKRARGEFTKGILKKTENDLNDFGYTSSSGVRLVKSFKAGPDGKLKSGLKRNKGGGIPGSGDTVPALLTPGEFVVNKKAAQSIGYGNLNSMNKTGVARFAKGGAVQTFANGGTAGGGGFGGSGLIILSTVAATATAAVEKLGDKSLEATNAQAAWTIGLENGLKALIQVGTIGVLAFQANKAIKEWAFGTEDATKKSEEATNATEDLAQSSKDAANAQKETDINAQVVNVQGGQQALSPDAVKASGLSEQEFVDRAFSPEKSGINFNDPVAVAKEKSEISGEIEGLRATSTRELQNVQDFGSDKKQLEGLKSLAELTATQKREQIEPFEGTVFEDAPGIQQLKAEIAELDATAAKADEQIKSLDDKIAASTDAAGSATAQADLYQLALEKVKQEEQAAAAATADAAKKAKEARSAIENVAIAGFGYAAQKADEAKTALSAFGTNVKNKVVKEAKNATEGLKKFGVQLIGGEKNLKAAREALGRVGERAKKLKDGANKLAGGFGRGAVGVVKFINKQTAFTRIVKGSAKAVGATAKAISGLAQRIRNLGSRAGGALKRGIGRAGGALKRGIGRASGVITGGVAAVAAIAAVGSQIADGFQQWFKRAEEQAKASDNIAGAVEAAGKASVASSIGEVFTLQGFIEAVSDPEGFVERRAQKKEQAQFQSAFGFIESRQGSSAEEIKGGQNVGQALSGVNEAFATARAEAQDLTGPARDKANKAIDSATRAEIQRLNGLGVSVADLRQQAINLTGGNEALRKELLAQVDTIEANRKAQQELNKANLDATKIVSAFGAAANASAQLVAGLETGANSLALLSEELDNASGKLGVDATDAINQSKAALLSSLPAGSPLAASISGQADVARATNKFGLNAAAQLGGLELAKGDEGKKQLEQALLDAIPDKADDATKTKLEAVIRKNVAGIEGDASDADLDALTQQILADGQELSKGFREAVKLQSQHNATMTKLYADREQLEQKAAAAANQAIETQLEAAKVFESFGGSKLTGEQQLGARIAQFNNIGGLGGLGAQLTTGDAADINAVAAQIGQTFADQTDQVISGALAAGAGLQKGGPFQGAGGFAADKRPEAQAANKALIQFTKQRISLLKEELNIVKQKNAAEKSALDKLISGDVEGFLDQQAAAGAGAALASGSAGLAGLFSASALGAGFKTLQGQGLSDQQLRGAEDLTLQRFGIQGTGVLSGTTAEEEALKAEGRELAGALGGLASQEAAFAKAEIAIQDATINAAQLSFDRKLGEVQSAQTAQALARGGVVYASRGMFVPRGTDTVPAMLTPGEFVVNRAAVNRGNNLQILRAMNTGGGASAPGALSGGGSVRYYNDGGFVDGIANVFTNALPGLTNIFSGFAETVEKLVNTKFNVALDPTNINVNFNGASFLETLKDDIKDGLLTEVGNEIQKYKANNSGDLVKKDSVL